MVTTAHTCAAYGIPRFLQVLARARRQCSEIAFFSSDQAPTSANNSDSDALSSTTSHLSRQILPPDMICTRNMQLWEATLTTILPFLMIQDGARLMYLIEGSLPGIIVVQWSKHPGIVTRSKIVDDLGVQKKILCASCTGRNGDLTV